MLTIIATCQFLWQCYNVRNGLPYSSPFTAPHEWSYASTHPTRPDIFHRDNLIFEVATAWNWQIVLTHPEISDQHIYIILLRSLLRMCLLCPAFGRGNNTSFVWAIHRRMKSFTRKLRQ